uniref:Uncharacterized protein n=1 Tax=Glossina palpalis gambiensis TaxID=67801 RepID=A0A1B0BP60_9MUSC
MAVCDILRATKRFYVVSWSVMFCKLRRVSCTCVGSQLRILRSFRRSSNWNCKRSNKVYNEKFISGMPAKDNIQLIRTRSSAMEFMRSFVSEQFKKSSQALSITSNADGGFAAKIFGVVLNTFEPREAEF